MHYLPRTILIWLAIFFAAQIIPPGSTLLMLPLLIIFFGAFLDFGLNISTNRGLIDHLFNSSQ